MTQEKSTSGEVAKIIDKKRQKAEAKAEPALGPDGKPLPPGVRKLTPEENQWVDQWCVGMRSVDQALLIFRLIKAVEGLVARQKERDKAGGIVAPDGSKL